MNSTSSPPRNSSLELLRLICCFLIITSHSILSWFGRDGGAAFNPMLILVFQQLFTIEVPCFILISGFFGINLSAGRLIRFELPIWIYSAAFLIWRLAVHQGVGFEGLIKGVFPVLTGKYWFFSCYMIVMCLSPFLNKIKDLIGQNTFKALLLVMLIFFFAAPTFLYWGPIDEGNAKTLCVFITYYLAGQYLSEYGLPFKKSISVLVFIFCFTLEFILNMLATRFMGAGLPFGYFSPMSRENSLFAFIISILVFWSFKEHAFYSGIINGFAKYVFAAMLLEGFIKNLAVHYLGFEHRASSVLQGIIFMLTESLIIMLAAAVIDALRRLIFEWAENIAVSHISDKISRIGLKLEDNTGN